MHLEEDVLTFILNLSGWVIVGYLTRDYFGRLKSVEEKEKQRDIQISDMILDQKLHEQKTEYMEKNISKIEASVEEIKTLIRTEREHLIEELKNELRGNQNVKKKLD